jgi:hypothetical protein
MNLSDMDKSKYLSGKDVGEVGAVFTIDHFALEELNKNEPHKLVLYFRDPGSKPMVVNKTNRKRLAAIFRTDDSDMMVGKRVHAFFDPLVEFQGEIKGGLRLKPAAQVPQGGSKAPNTRQAQVPPVEHDEQNPPPFDDEIPF